MLLSHQKLEPRIHESAYVAPSAVICGDVVIGPHSRIGFGVTVVAEGQRVTIGSQVIVRENAVIRASKNHPIKISDYVLVGPHATLMGCEIGSEVFLATGTTIFHGAVIGDKSEVRINGVVHVNSKLPPRSMVPIGWVAVGDPAKIYPPDQHDNIWEVQKNLNFPQTVYGLDRLPDGGVDMKELTRRLAESLGEHRSDKRL